MGPQRVRHYFKHSIEKYILLTIFSYISEDISSKILYFDSNTPTFWWKESKFIGEPKFHKVVKLKTAVVELTDNTLLRVPQVISIVIPWLQNGSILPFYDCEDLGLLEKLCSHWRNCLLEFLTCRWKILNGYPKGLLWTEKQQVAFNLSVLFSHSVVSDSLRPCGLQHARLPCPSPVPGVYSNSCPLSRWCHPTTSSSVVPFSSHLQSFPASGYFQMSQIFASGGQSIRVSASTSISFQWTPRTDLLEAGLVGSPCCSRDFQGSSPTPQFKSINSSVFSFLYNPYKAV